MKKNIKIAVLDVWTGFNLEIMTFYHILTEAYDVVLEGRWEDADYVFYSCFGNEHWSVTPDKIKIFFTAENITPDFNACDYAIGFDWMDFGDRYLRMSNYYSRHKSKCHTSDRFEEKEQKTEFCSFVVSNALASEYRVQLFEQLSRYKKVDSGGRFLNNVGGPVENKLLFDSRHKFSICCENSAHPGYCTEKLYQAFDAGCIPIYWGDPEVGRVFNTKAFINANDYDSIEEVVAKVIEIDNDEEKYLAMLQQPVFLKPEEENFTYQSNRLREFLYNIFDQEIESAKRYNRHATHFNYAARMVEINRLCKTPLKKILLSRLKTKFLGKH